MAKINEKPEIKIPDPEQEAVGKLDFFIKIVLGVLFIGFLTMLLMVAGLVLDAWRFKTNSYESLIETIRSQEILNKNYQNEKAENQNILESISNKLDDQRSEIDKIKNTLNIK